MNKKDTAKSFLCIKSMNISIPQEQDFLQKGLKYILKKDSSGNIFVYTLKNNKLSVSLSKENLAEFFKLK